MGNVARNWSGVVLHKKYGGRKGGILQRGKKTMRARKRKGRVGRREGKREGGWLGNREKAKDLEEDYVRENYEVQMKI